MASIFRIRRILLHQRYFPSRGLQRGEQSLAAETPNTTEEKEEVAIPLVPKRRDPHAVLKALSSTISPLQHPILMGGRGLADPLVPKNRIQHLDYLRAREAGKKAAGYVIRRWPKMFPDIKPDPATPRFHLAAVEKINVFFHSYKDLRTKKTVVRGCSESTLKQLIAMRKTTKALKMYRKLQEKGESVSLETQNELLALLAYYGMGNRWKGDSTKQRRQDARSSEVTELEAQVEHDGDEGELEKKDLLELKEMEEKEMSSDSSTDETSDESESSSDEEGGGLGTVTSITGGGQAASTTSGVRTEPPPVRNKTGIKWSLNNLAEKFFAEMTEKDGGTYDALIQGLIKFQEVDRAFEMFQEMREKHHQASLATYNSLLATIANASQLPYSWKKTMGIVKHMTKEPVVKPDITTMNLILSVSRKTHSSSRNFALETMREIAYLGLEPTLTTFLRLLQAYLMHADGSILYEITDYLEKNEHILTFKEKHDLYFLSSAMSAARLLRDCDLAVRLKRLAMKDNWFLVDALSFCLSHYLITLATSGEIGVLRQEYRSLVPNTIIPFEWVYGSMFRACEGQDPAFALEMWQDMMKYRVPIERQVTVERLCGAFSGAIDPNNVESYLAVLRMAWKKMEYLKLKPPSFLISQMLRLHTIIDELDQAWDMYSNFAEYNIPPTFLALSSLLKGHCGHRDTDSEKIVEIMEIMISMGMTLPTKYIRDICWTINVSSEKKNELLAGFSKNERGSRGSTGKKMADLHQDSEHD